MSYSLDSLKGYFYFREYIKGLLGGILGVETINPKPLTLNR